MSESGSDYSEPAESPIQGDDPTGSVSVWDENDLAFGPEEESADVARKWPGAVQNSLGGSYEQDVSETPPPKRASNGFSNEPLDLHETSAAKESQNLGSVRLAMHWRLSGCALAERLELCFERSCSPVKFLPCFCQTFKTTASFSDWGLCKSLSGSSAGCEKGIFPSC